MLNIAGAHNKTFQSLLNVLAHVVNAVQGSTTSMS